MLQTWPQVFILSLQGLWYGFIMTIPQILLAILIFIIGWIVASTVGKLVMAAIDSLKLDRHLKNAGTDAALARAGMHLHIGKLIGELVKWFIIIVFLVASLNVLHLDQVTIFLQEVLAYIPQVIIAALILVAGTILADFVRKIVTGSAAIANVRSARMIGSIAYYAILILSIVTALEKLGIFGVFGQILITGIMLMIAIAVGLSFGLGGKDAAARFINRVADDLSNKQ